MSSRIELQDVPGEDLNEVIDGEDFWVDPELDRSRVALDSVAVGGLPPDWAMPEGLLLDCIVRLADRVNHGAVVLDAMVVAWEVFVRVVLWKSAWLISAEVMPATRTPSSATRVEPVTVEQPLSPQRRSAK
jgi:hypothetical protein